MNVERYRTPLLAWLEDNHVTEWDLGKATGIQCSLLRLYKQNGCLPSLVNAFKIEKATGGDVPAECWVKTPLGVNRWNKVDPNAWPNYREGAKLRQRRYRERKRQAKASEANRRSEGQTP